METRRRIEAGMGLMDMITTMSEGNPGAVSVLAQISNKDPVMGGFMELLSLDDMNIRGTQIWVAYKDFAKEDIDIFLEAVKKRDSKMVDEVNKQGQMGNHDHVAVTSGASFNRSGIF